MSTAAASFLWILTQLLQAEPAPAEPARQFSAATSHDAAHSAPTYVSFAARLAGRVGAPAVEVPPSLGFSLGIGFQHRYAWLGPVGLGVGVDMFYDRFSTTVDASTVEGGDGTQQIVEGIRLVSHATFAALQTATFETWRIRFWGGGGAGLSVAYFSTDEESLGRTDATDLIPLVRVAGGLEYAWNPVTFVGIRADYSWLIGADDVTIRSNEDGETETRSLAVFGDLFDIGLSLGYRF